MRLGPELMARHQGPTSIGLYTIYKKPRHDPGVFLRGLLL
jgi:hypothetical protein